MTKTTHFHKLETEFSVRLPSASSEWSCRWNVEGNSCLFSVCQSVSILTLDFVRLSLMSPGVLTRTQGSVVEISDAQTWVGLPVTWRACYNAAHWAPLRVSDPVGLGGP